MNSGPTKSNLPLRPFHMLMICIFVLLALIVVSQKKKLVLAFPPVRIVDFNIQKGAIHPLLHAQGLSHSALHQWPLQSALANLATDQPKKIVIAGVAHGLDVLFFLRAGYKVIAFEPMKQFYDRVLEKSKVNSSWDLKFYNNAAGNDEQAGSELKLTYQNKVTDLIKIVKIDDHVKHEPVPLMSIDVQGNELDVLQGAKSLVFNHVKIMWFEVGACKSKTVPLFKFLDNHFVLFDFVPVVKPLDQLHQKFNESNNFLYYENRPGSFEKYTDWMCQSKQGYKNVQTDILAIRRDYLPKVWDQLKIIGEQTCSHPEAGCILRSFLKSDQQHQLLM